MCLMSGQHNYNLSMFEGLCSLEPGLLTDGLVTVGFDAGVVFMDLSSDIAFFEVMIAFTFEGVAGPI